MKKWIQKHLLDKNNNISTQKKKKHLTDVVISELKDITGYKGEDVNSLIYSVFLDIFEHQYCPECGEPLLISKRGYKSFYCSLKCSNASKVKAQKISDGVRNAYQTKSVLEKRIQTNLEKYGVEHYLQQPGVAQRIANTSKRKTFKKDDNGLWIQQRHLTPEIVAKLDDRNYLLSLYEENLTHHEIAEIVGVSASTIDKRIQQYGFPKRTLNISAGEREILEFVSSLTDSVVSQDRKIFSNRMELDIYVPNHSFAIEHHGVYWHSLTAEDTHRKNDHLIKLINCKEKNIDLMQIYETEWKNKSEIIKSMIRSRMSLSERVFARKCVVKELSPQEARTFVENNHVSGYSNSSVKLGLFENGTLLACMTFSKSRFDKSVEWEINRFCTLLNKTVVGGASKLFTHFLREYSVKSVISYSDRRFGEGKVYEALGFKHIGHTVPNYVWYLGNNQFLSRYQTQKLNRGKMTEDQFMFSKGARKLYDAGNNKYIWNTSK
jgi:hypothetical protein